MRYNISVPYSFAKHLLLLMALFISMASSAQKTSSKSLQSKVFDKIVFHTGPCFGACPIYHLEISNNESNENKKKMGYFTGSLDQKKVTQLEQAIKVMGPDTIQFNGPNCCDGPIVSIILYYGGQKKSFTAMFPPEQAATLINLLNRWCREYAWQRSKTAFTVEDPEPMR
jgi:hypothetical protein